MTSTDGRSELVEIVKERHPSVKTYVWDIEVAPSVRLHPHEIVYCYGLLYHVKNPVFVLENIPAFATELLLTETCVSFGQDRC